MYGQSGVVSQIPTAVSSGAFEEILTWRPSARVTLTPSDLGLQRGDAVAAGSAGTENAGVAVDLGLRRGDNASAAGAAGVGDAGAANISFMEKVLQNGTTETTIMRHGPSATHPRAPGVTGFGVGDFGELSAGCFELSILVARVQAASYVACYGDKTPKIALDAQRPRIRRLWGLTTQVGGARLIIERCTEFVSSGDSESPVTDFEVDRDAGTL